MMTPEQIKSNAPDGATHYDIERDYLRLYKDKWSVWDGFHEIWKPIHTPTEEIVTMFEIKPL